MYNEVQKFNSFSMHITQGSNNFFPLILETRLSNCHTGFHGQHQTVHNPHYFRRELYVGP